MHSDIIDPKLKSNLLIRNISNENVFPTLGGLQMRSKFFELDGLFIHCLQPLDRMNAFIFVGS